MICLTAQVYVQGNTKANSAIVGSIGALNETNRDVIWKAFEGTKASRLHVDSQIGTIRKVFFT